jgi:hypothetical protein
MVVRYIQNMLKTSINYFKMSKMYGSISQNMLKYVLFNYGYRYNTTPISHEVKTGTSFNK